MLFIFAGRTEHSERSQERQQYCHHETRQRHGVVILKKDDYHKKMDEILADTSKFELLDDDAVKLTIKRENQVKTLLKKLKSDNCISAKNL